MNSTFNKDLFYLYLSNSMVAFPAFRKFTDKLYETQKCRFYEKAKSNQYYNHTLMSDRSLEMEVSMKRTFGILLCSDEDKHLQKLLCDEIFKFYTPIKYLTEKFSMDDLKKSVKQYLKRQKKMNLYDDESIGIFFFVTYIIIHKYGLDCENNEIQQLYTLIELEVNSRAEFAQSPFLKRLNAFNPRNSVTIPRYVKKTKECVTNGNYLTAFIDLINCYVSSAQVPNKYAYELFNSIEKYITEETMDYKLAMMYCHLLSNVMSAEGYSFSMLLNGRDISKKTQDIVLKITAISLELFKIPKMNVHYYIVTLLFYMLIENLKDSRSFYFENNSETQFNELMRSSREITALKEEISEKDKIISDNQQYIEALKSQIDNLTSELSKDTKDAVKPLMGEIKMLRTEVSKLQQRLDEELEKTQELNRLREFVFAIQQGEDIVPKEVSLEELIKDKTIYIFGGHVNWRTKLKAKYPTLTVLDGHNTSFDEKQLLNADIVLMNTSNMSHSLYYKVVDVLRRNKITFDYLGKYINQNLLEQEIAEVLKNI